MKALALRLAALVLPLVLTPSTNAQGPGRLLASNCFQCHGTNGSGGFERLAGLSADKIFEEMKELQGDPAQTEPEKEIMTVHANAYSDDEIRAIARYLSRQ